ncbi:PREDICTED: putative uncharacterized protein FLJ22184 [Bison bison bison]|uniref:Uncharacterized protein n=1 Tax=Bison bison bison TaxID=43346 RepID=A0A6P3GZ97_BISBB|nr:PREDICTED: putative uncharacterized protein FLJ22184 [Bison bison bison]
MLEPVLGSFLACPPPELFYKMPQKDLLLQEVPCPPAPFCSLAHPPPDIQRPSAPPPARLRPPPTSSPPLHQFQTFLDNEVISPLPIGCAGPSVTGIRGSRPPRGLRLVSTAVTPSAGVAWWGVREAGVVGGPAASVPERSRPRPCLWCPRGGSGERDRPILPTLSAPLAARPPLSPTYPQLRASRLDAEPREETRAVESRSGDRRGARPGRRARRDRRGMIGMELNFICLWEL